MTDTLKRGRGRPKGSPNKKSKPGRDYVLYLRVTPDAGSTYDAAAERAGMTRANWMRAALDKAAKP